eukprot:m.67223 g.67223  ORF g.67223 m.67223 type:complete len:113 (-) comp12160_c0_seq2:2854-3192(-)
MASPKRSTGAVLSSPGAKLRVLATAAEVHPQPAKTEGDGDKLRLKRERNRQAAKRFRQKLKDETETYKTQLSETQALVKVEEAKLAKLQATIKALQSTVDEHECKMAKVTSS